MDGLRPVSSGRLRRASAVMWLALAVGALGMTAGCGGDDSRPKESKAELEAELATLPTFLEKDFRAGDTNNDLRIQDSELEAMVEEDFKVSDRDKDGVISADDIRQGSSKQVDVEGSLAPFDLDKNGRVPLREYAQHVEVDLMKEMDSNKDGHLDPAEVSRVYGAQDEEPK